MRRHVLLIELDGDCPDTAMQRIREAVPDVRVWRTVEPVDAALLVFDVPLVAA